MQAEQYLAFHIKSELDKQFCELCVSALPYACGKSARSNEAFPLTGGVCLSYILSSEFLCSSEQIFQISTSESPYAVLKGSLSP